MNTLNPRAARALGGLALAAMLLAPLASSAAEKPKHEHHHLAKSYMLYVGGYTRVSGKGIYAYRYNPATGDVAPLGLIESAVNPSWLTASHDHRFLYAGNEHPTKGAPETGNSITAYARDPMTGKLTLLNRVPSGGEGPAHLAVDKTGKILAVANFGTGAVTTFKLNADGSIGPMVSNIVQAGHAAGAQVAKDDNGLSPTDSHIHCVMITPDNRYVLTCNIGLGKITAYRLNAETGALEQAGEPLTAPALPGQRWRPRHLAFDPSGKFIYINDSSMQVTTASYDPATGAMKLIQSIPMDPGGPPHQSWSGSEVRVDHAGKFVYTSARAVDASLKSAHLDGAIMVYAVDPATHHLTPVQHIASGGDSPRSFAFDPSGKYLFVGNEYSGTLDIFAVDKKTGMLNPTGKVLKDVPEPSAYVFEAEK